VELLILAVNVMVSVSPISRSEKDQVQVLFENDASLFDRPTYSRKQYQTTDEFVKGERITGRTGKFSDLWKGYLVFMIIGVVFTVINLVLLGQLVYVLMMPL